MDGEGETAGVGAAVKVFIVDVGSVESRSVIHSTSTKSKSFINECMNICRPPLYHGRSDYEVTESVLSRLEMYLRLLPDTEEEKVCLAACFLTGDAEH